MINRILAAATAALALGACSPTSDRSAVVSDNTASGADTIAAATPSPTPAAVASAATARVLTLEGLGDLRIGEPVPAGGVWRERGAQTGEGCRTVSAPDFPGVYAIVTGGKVRRITVGQRSDVKLTEGIGVGTSEGDVAKWFASFRAEPHKYVAAPAKYLTAPNAANSESALRFEIGRDGKVSMMHVGTMPELALVEGCA